MSDPYNSYGASLPPGPTPAPSPVTPAPPRVAADPIARLDVSEGWKRKFRLIERAGGPTLPRFGDLAFGERVSLNFNFLAFFLGPFYYLAKGLWQQALLFLGAAVALVIVLDVSGLEGLARGVGYGFGALYALRANVSYYRKAVLGESPWF